MILLDTCVLFWLEHQPDAISASARARLADSSVAGFASAISALELGLKVAHGRLRLPLPPGAWVSAVCERRGIRELPVTFRIAGESALLPPLHKDPFDRLLVATAMAHRLTLLTPDPLIRQYPGLSTAW